MVVATLACCSPASAQTAVEVANLLITASDAGTRDGPDRWVHDTDDPCLLDPEKTCHAHCETVRVDDCRYRFATETEDGRTEGQVDFAKATSFSAAQNGMSELTNVVVGGMTGLICDKTTIQGLPPQSCRDKISDSFLHGDEVAKLSAAYTLMTTKICKR